MNTIDHSGEMPLIHQAIQGDIDSFNHLVLRYQSMAYNLAYTILHDHYQAEDVTQESFIKAYRKISQFRGGSFRSWLLRIVTNTAYDHIRRFSRHRSVALFLEGEDRDRTLPESWVVDTAISVEAAVERGELSSHIQQILAELPPIYRSVITLIDLYDFDYSETAKSLGIPTGTIKSRLARARCTIREKLQQHANDHYLAAAANFRVGAQ